METCQLACDTKEKGVYVFDAIYSSSHVYMQMTVTLIDLYKTSEFR